MKDIRLVDDDKAMTEKTFETAIFGAGCFWCTEAVFQQIRGVTIVESGYAGGKLDYPTYQQVCEGTTGHAEVVRLTFDSQIVSFRALLEVFFSMHDPTSHHQQGSDVGSQYRSVIFFDNAAQKATAKQVMQEMKSSCRAPITTELKPAPFFYFAEEHHQNYYKNNPDQAYCAIVLEPKLKKVRNEPRVAGLLR